MTARLLVIIVFFIPGLCFGGNAPGTTVRTEVKKEFYEDGSIRRITKTRIRRTRQFELYNFYKRTAVTVTEFYEDGNVRYREKVITKIGDSGRPCYEVVTVKKNYYRNGNRRNYEKWICDERKGIYKEYDDRGKLVFTRIHKNKR